MCGGIMPMCGGIMPIGPMGPMGPMGPIIPIGPIGGIIPPPPTMFSGRPTFWPPPPPRIGGRSAIRRARSLPSCFSCTSNSTRASISCSRRVAFASSGGSAERKKKTSSPGSSGLMKPYPFPSSYWHIVPEDRGLPPGWGMPMPMPIPIPMPMPIGGGGKCPSIIIGGGGKCPFRPKPGPWMGFTRSALGLPSSLIDSSKDTSMSRICSWRASCMSGGKDRLPKKTSCDSCGHLMNP